MLQYPLLYCSAINLDVVPHTQLYSSYVSCTVLKCCVLYCAAFNINVTVCPPVLNCLQYCTPMHYGVKMG